jgi:hypothetical protein
VPAAGTSAAASTVPTSAEAPPAVKLSETRQVSSDARRRLIENLNEQYARAKFVDQLLPPTKVVTAVNYREEILKMLESVRTTNNITEMSRFWSNASSLTVARNQLTEAIHSTL